MLAIILDLVAESTESGIYCPSPAIGAGEQESGLSQRYSVVDIFAGPGGLAEGFSKVKGPSGKAAFKIALSIEKDVKAHSTLVLRSFIRQFAEIPPVYYEFINGYIPEPDWEIDFPVEWKRACEEAWLMELGAEDPDLRLNNRLDEIHNDSRGQVVLIGGPPCQAYSLVGRARNAGKKDYVASEDQRHFLYQEYIRILDRLKPVAFVMENVKGMLSSSIDGSNRLIDRVLEDLKGNRPGAQPYQLIALDPRKDTGMLPFEEPSASDFIVRAERFGIPQSRHRLIVVGIRSDVAANVAIENLMSQHGPQPLQTRVKDVLEGMPLLRSGLSKTIDGDEEWKKTVSSSIALVSQTLDHLPREQRSVMRRACKVYHDRLVKSKKISSRNPGGTGISPTCPEELKVWLTDPLIKNLPNNDARSHMISDLARYFFCSLYTETLAHSPKSSEWPNALAPGHASWSSGKFADRFRVQDGARPASTITCHISKDGHYYIHPDPAQCRSLTVREAARLQTFPDNYFFKGGRTDQYVQVGNAVPPLLAMKIGNAVSELLADQNRQTANAGTDRI